MKHGESTFEDFLTESYARLRELPPVPIDAAWDRVISRLDNELDSASGNLQVWVDAPCPTVTISGRWPALVTLAAVVLCAIGVSLLPSRFSSELSKKGSGGLYQASPQQFDVASRWMLTRQPPLAVVESKDGGLDRVSVGEVLNVDAGIEANQRIKTHSEGGTVLRLSDGSKIEMRSNSELSLERADDGVRIYFTRGEVIVNAGKQRNGHLYVQTKDLSVSVVGTVFLVKAGQQGSRVAVIEGEVHVIKGATTERLFPGEQVATSSLMPARPVIEEVSWSRHAKQHIAMLQQTAIPPVTTAGGLLDRFEVASIRLGDEQRSPGLRPGDPVRVRPCPGGNPFEMTQLFQLNPGRLVMRRLPVYYLIGLAYGNSCPASGTLTGGPEWTRTSRYDLEATIPAGTPKYTKEQLLSGNAPQLQRMLQNLLADRFKLVLKREVKETQGYDLVIAQAGKLKLSADQTTDQVPVDQGGRGAIAISYLSAPIARLARHLQELSGRPVVDKTGLSGLYDFRLEFPEIAYPTPQPAGAPRSEIQPGDNMSWVDQIDQKVRDLLPRKLEATTGLRLEEANVPVEVLVIVSVERPSSN